MATTPLSGIGTCQARHGRNLFRDNQGNGNLVLIGMDSVLDVRISTDDGITWSEPTALSDSITGTSYACMQDSDGNFHVLESAGSSHLYHHKITVTRSGGDISSLSETAVSLSGYIAEIIISESISIAEVSDNESTPVKRIAVSFVEEKTSGSPSSQNVWIQMLVTKRSVGLSPSSFVDFTNLNGGATVETVKQYTGSTTSGPRAHTRIEYIKSGTDIGDIYIAACVYDVDNSSAREFILHKAALNTPGSGVPYWASFTSVATGSTPATTSDAMIDMAWDSNNSRIILCLQDSTSTSATNIDFWTISTTGTISKTPPEDNLTADFGHVFSASIGWDSNGDLWLLYSKESSAASVAQYKSSTWTSYAWKGSASNYWPSLVKDNTGNRIFWSISFTSTGDPNICSANITELSETLKTSGGTYSSADVAMNQYGVPDLMPYDYTLTIYHKSGGWTDAIDFQHDGEVRYIASGTTCTIKANAAEAFNDSSATTPGKWDTGRVYFDRVGTCIDTQPLSVAGDLVIEDLQLTSDSNNTVILEGDTASGTITIQNCLLVGPGTSGDTINMWTQVSSAEVRVYNCGIRVLGTSATAGGIGLSANATTGTNTVDSCTVYSASTSASAAGIRNADTSQALVVTNTVVEVATTTADRAYVDSGGGWGASDYNVSASGNASTAGPGGANDTDDQSSAQLALVDPANGDLRIGSGSTAIDAGSTALTADVTGMSRFTPHDTGFYDFTRGYIINDGITTGEQRTVILGGVTQVERNAFEGVILQEVFVVEQNEVPDPYTSFVRFIKVF